MAVERIDFLGTQQVQRMTKPAELLLGELLSHVSFIVYDKVLRVKMRDL